ncbi:MAG: NYN domain-containing protein [Candidatus Kuenenbacteria bacterium]
MNNQKRKFYTQKLSQEIAIIAYLDLTNMFHWQDVLKWGFRIEDVIIQLQKISSVKEIKVFYGFNGKKPNHSYSLRHRIGKIGATLRTKPVKFIKKNIDEALLFKSSTRTFFDDGINSKLEELIIELKRLGTIIEEPKCNFDVEITMEIMDDLEKVSTILLFSGDSDLMAPLERAKLKGKKIYVVGVRGMTAGELHKVKDLYIDFGKFYDGKKNYIKSENPAFGGTA